VCEVREMETKVYRRAGEKSGWKSFEADSDQGKCDKEITVPGVFISSSNSM
jgi:hypothetical protein